MCYSGEIICDVDNVPEDYDSKKDWYFDCDCEFQEWGRLVKIEETNKKQNKNG